MKTKGGRDMPSLQIRELPESIYQKLKEQAGKEFRSLSQQAIITLAKGLGIHEDPKDRRRKVLERIAQEPVDGSETSLPDPVVLIREDRKR